ncbi:hypothetical protein DV737_g4231, partial [Chaetothyriales sp. CBS 132003]
MATEASIALTNRSLRSIRTELEFLTDTGVITADQLSSILSQLPSQTPLRAPLQVTTGNAATTTPVDQFGSLSLKEPALYAYQPTDAGDLALQPNDRILVLEHMNNDWWRGRNERTGMEGIFPRSYVSELDEKRPPMPGSNGSDYGNMPLAVAQSGSSAQPGRTTSKLEEHGKKFGKKMGNAAIFGAGATIGSNIVNGIF